MASAAASLCRLHNTPSVLPFLTSTFSKTHLSVAPLSSQTQKRCRIIIGSVAKDREATPVVSEDRGGGGGALFHEHEEGEGSASSPSKPDVEVPPEPDSDSDLLTSRAINAAIILGFGTFAVTKLLTIDHDYWHVSIYLLQLTTFKCSVCFFIIIII